MGDSGEWGWQTDLRLSRKKHTHQYGCVDPFCTGCMLQGYKNSSQCISINVKIFSFWNNFLEGVTSSGEIVIIHTKFLDILLEILPPGINLIGKIFAMTIMKNCFTIVKTPRTPWRCINVFKIPYQNDICIIHPKASLPFSKGTMIQIPL